MHPAEQRRRILAAATQVFSTLGFDGAKTRDIAEEAGLPEAAIYRHFRSKEELFSEAILARVERLAEELARLHSEFPSLTGRMRLERSEETHRKLWKALQELAPLLGVALFTNTAAGSVFYTERLSPLWQRAANALGAAMHSSAKEKIHPRAFFISLLGLYYALSFDDGPEPDAETLAAAITSLLAFGVHGASQPKVRAPRAR